MMQTKIVVVVGVTRGTVGVQGDGKGTRPSC